MSRVVVGLSGGVDSSVAAQLLVEQGHEVIGIFMRNWHDESVIIDDECPWIEDSNDAMAVAEQLGIPFQVLDLSAEYHDRVVDYMFREYEMGRTPNPDVLCNREIKFDVFLKFAMQLGADFVATGHYCRKEEFVNSDGKTIYRLLAGKDPGKDQSYFLCGVSQDQISKALFPIGHLQKSEVRDIAAKMGFVTAEKKDSQGLCFVGKVRLPEFLQQKLAVKHGDVVEIPADLPGLNSDEQKTLFDKSVPPSLLPEYGNVVAEHPGAHFFTIGQRKGLNVGGRPLPSFVIATDVNQNIVYTGLGEDHPGLYRSTIRVRADEIHWLRIDLALAEGETRRYLCRIRYRQPLEWAEIRIEDGWLFASFDNPQRGVAAGQFLAWYDDDELIGSGIIAE